MTERLLGLLAGVFLIGLMPLLLGLSMGYIVGRLALVLQRSGHGRYIPLLVFGGAVLGASAVAALMISGNIFIQGFPW